MRQKYKYDFAISFAGSERNFAEELAKKLVSHGYSVFYDKFHQHDLWGKDLSQEFEKIFVDQCRYSVVLITENYTKRMWTTLESKHIISRFVAERGAESILPIFLNGYDKKLSGLPITLGYISVTDSESEYILDLLMKKWTVKKITKSDNYLKAYKAIENIKKGILEYDKIFFSTEEIEPIFPKLYPSTVLSWEGNEFYWFKEPRKPLHLLATNSPPTLSKICSLNVPEDWIGCGRWRLYVPVDKDTEKIMDDKGIILALSFGDKNFRIIKDMKEVDTENFLPSYFLAAIYLKNDTAQLFYDMAETNYQDIR